MASYCLIPMKATMASFMIDISSSSITGSPVYGLTDFLPDKTVINNERINTFLICQRFDCINYRFGAQRCKAQPVGFLPIEESIEGVLREGFPVGTGFLLHVHASVREDIAELVFEDLKNRNSLFFLRIAFAE